MTAVTELAPRETASGPGRRKVQLNLISDFEICCADKSIAMSPSSQRLLSFVALHDRPVRRALVRAALWLDSTDERANASLRSALWRVPAPDGQPLLHASMTHLWLDHAVEVDFHRMIALAHDILSGNASAASAIRVARDLSSLGADLLPGWYDDWVIMERERFHHLRLQALEQMGQHLCEIGRLCDALQVGLAAVQAEPLRESARRLVIGVHLRQGNIAEAAMQYRRYEQLLAQELQVSPTPAIRALIDPYLA
jgi:DNA-binding SARP family transcriptional activator